ncbi:MAG: pyrimidine dimer DNA glycosylase/endonuclease V [Betaproteobacteria bacterium]
MRIWSLHPKYLDARGLVALWREGLLAQAVLKGMTKGYVNHPQLLRFQERSSPVGFIAEYLRGVHGEAVNRGYLFAVAKISRSQAPGCLTVTRGQLEFEWRHLMQKLRARDPEWRARLATVKTPQPHPLFRVVRGNIADWEKDASTSGDPSRRKRQ